VTDSTCAFCGSALPFSLRAAASAPPLQRVGRAATFAFGVAVAGATVLGCGDDDGPAPGTDSGVVADAGGGGGDSGMRDAGPGGTDAGPGGTDAGSAAPDAGPGGTDAGSAAPDAGPGGTDAGFDAGGGIAPLYGAPPPA